MHRISLLAGIMLVAFATPPTTAASAQTVALSGQVTSAEEGAMEGVLVSAKKAGSTITITVVSDRDGRSSFRTPNGSTAFRATIRARACSSIVSDATRSNASCVRPTAPKNFSMSRFRGCRATSIKAFRNTRSFAVPND
jgi:hypothetical protein